MAAHCSMRVAPLEHGMPGGDHVWECTLKSPITSAGMVVLMSSPRSILSNEVLLMS